MDIGGGGLNYGLLYLEPEFIEGGGGGGKKFLPPNTKGAFRWPLLI